MIHVKNTKSKWGKYWQYLRVISTKQNIKNINPLMEENEPRI